MKELSLPNAWSGLGQYSGNPVTFSLMYKGFCFTGMHSLEIEDPVHPIVVTIETLYLDDNVRDVLSIIDPAIVQWLEAEIRDCTQLRNALRSL